MKKIYISGKITGLSQKGAERIFQDAEDALSERYPNTEIINPMKEVPYEKGKTWEEYMLDDIGLLFGCDCIYMINNWESSKGARVECSIAKEMGKNIIFQK